MERTILVAEDSPTQAERLRLLLEGEGYRVDVVASGREGLERVQAAPPDLIISDVVMPEMDGYAFCQAVKSSMRTRRTPFVLLTERNTPADFIGGLQHGADNFITKPYEDDYLLERVRRIFENLDLRRAGRQDVEVTLNLGGRQIVINADKQQMIELLFSTFEELDRMNTELLESRRAVEEYARTLEEKVRERTREIEALKVERELRGLERLARTPQSPVTARLLGVRPLREALPGAFAELVARYGEVIDRAIEQQAYRVEHHVSEALRALGEELGGLGAGPRDVVEIHGTVLRRLGAGPAPKARAYAEEARLIALELMGHLAAYYRNLCVGAGAPGAQREKPPRPEQEGDDE